MIYFFTFLAACVVFMPVVGSYDFVLMNLLNGPISGFDPFFILVSKSSAGISISVAVVLLVSQLYKEHSIKNLSGIYACCSIAIAALGTYLIKQLLQRVRPNVAYPDFIFEKEHLSGWSFPSGHSSGVFAIAFYLCLIFPRWYVVLPAFTYAIMVAYSRIYLGVHYPSDVMAGALLGLVTTYLVFSLESTVKIVRPILRKQ
jgi:undecaprenyl-diphosphatase